MCDETISPNGQLSIFACSFGNRAHLMFACSFGNRAHFMLPSHLYRFSQMYIQQIPFKVDSHAGFVTYKAAKEIEKRGFVERQSVVVLEGIIGEKRKPKLCKIIPVNVFEVF